MQLRLALRNVFRNRRRTLFSLSVLALSTTILVIVLGFQAQFLRSIRSSLACETGALQIADRRLFDNETSGYDYLIPEATLAEVIALVETQDGVTGVTWRLDFAGLAGDETGSALILGRGVVLGSGSEPYECLVVDGAPLSATADREAILGSELARRLGVAAGARLNIATGTVSGNFNAATVTVVGELTYSIEEVEAQLGLFPIAFVQRLLKTDGVERILVSLEELDDAAAVAARVEQELAAAGIPLVARTWEELNSSYESIRSFYTAFSGLAALGIFVFVFFSVLEVLTISFLERTREIGTLRAFGTTRARVFRTFLIEGAVLGLLGGPAGVLVGVAFVLVFNAVGIPWTPPGAAIPQTLRLAVGPQALVVPLLLAAVATLASALYPSWKASRQSVVDALRSV